MPTTAAVATDRDNDGEKYENNRVDGGEDDDRERARVCVCVSTVMTLIE